MKSVDCPLVSVVMGCYNSEAFIREAIDSILSQTLKDFEFIIIDDGSTDKTVEVVKSYNDSRIHLIQNQTNRGLGYSLYTGVKMSRGKYIARMDADDISLPYRLERQVDFLSTNPDYLIVGSACAPFSGKNDIRISKRIISKEKSMSAIRSVVLFGVPFVHPSVMMNAAIMKRDRINYNSNFRKAQDYELWSRVVWDYKSTNLSEVLLKYRQSPTQASRLYHHEQLNYSKLIWAFVLPKILCRDVSDDELNYHYLSIVTTPLNNNQLNSVANWNNELYEMSINNALFDSDVLLKNMLDRWLKTCVCSLPKLKRFHWFSRLPQVKSKVMMARYYFHLLHD